jgi:hypothetical protein
MRTAPRLVAAPQLLRSVVTVVGLSLAPTAAAVLLQDVHVLTCSRAHVLTCSRAHVLTCSRLVDVRCRPSRGFQPGHASASLLRSCLAARRREPCSTPDAAARWNGTVHHHSSEETTSTVGCGLSPSVVEMQWHPTRQLLTPSPPSRARLLCIRGAFDASATACGACRVCTRVRMGVAPMAAPPVRSS